MDWDKLIELLAQKNLAAELEGKRPGVPKLPGSLYIRLIMAAIATEKDIGTCISSALETYTMRNEEKHLIEIKLKAAAAGMGVEEYLVQAITSRITTKYQQGEEG